ncbi:MAG: hypothetical protein U0821_13060 [Chloroflexota bacterium]
MLTTTQWHRQQAAALFNLTWTFLDNPTRTPFETDQMIHAAHASRYHWSVVGEPVNLARGEWQIARVYAVAGLPEASQYHGRRCLELCDAHSLSAFDRACAYEALARAHAIAGDRAAAGRWLDLGRAMLASIEDVEDREIAESDLATVFAEGS